jgi:ubiquinone/menaquinone biosynthesis C-methylase UbiE
MTQFADKVFRGEQTTEQEWVDYLKYAHEVAPGMTPNPYDRIYNDDGESSYKVLADVLRESQIPIHRVLDLACGDGHLMTYIDRTLAGPIEMVGIDMSKHELKLAREKNFRNRVDLKLEMAQSLSCESQSIDAALSHMAFMLMTPIEPVVRELHRVLKPGAIFATITDGASPTKGFFPVYREMRRKFMSEKFPNFRPGKTGDERLSTSAGLREVLEPHFSQIQTYEFDVTEKFPVNQMWSIFKDYYYVSAMPEKERDEFARLFVRTAEQEADLDGKVMLQDCFKLMTCRRV